MSGNGPTLVTLLLGRKPCFSSNHAEVSHDSWRKYCFKRRCKEGIAKSENFLWCNFIQVSAFNFPGNRVEHYYSKPLFLFPQWSTFESRSFIQFLHLRRRRRMRLVRNFAAWSDQRRSERLDRSIAQICLSRSRLKEWVLGKTSRSFVQKRNKVECQNNMIEIKYASMGFYFQGFALLEQRWPIEHWDKQPWLWNTPSGTSNSQLTTFMATYGYLWGHTVCALCSGRQVLRCNISIWFLSLT